MIFTDTHLEYFRKNPKAYEIAQAHPYAYFGSLFYPKQASIIREWLRRQPKVSVISGWKRTGKTNVGSYLGTCWMMSGVNHKWPGARTMQIPEDYEWKRRIGGDRVGLIGGKSLDHVDKVLLRQYRDLLPATFIKHWFTQSNKAISLFDGTYSVVRTYDQDLEAWKSGAYQFIHLDEEPPHGVLMECLERTRTTKGKILITVALDDADLSYLPEACDNPIKIFGTEDFMHVELGVEDVPTSIYPEEEKKIVFRQYDGTPWEKAVRKGSFAHVGGKWWSHFNIDSHVIKPFPIPADWLKYRAMDAGFNAPTGGLWAALHPREPIVFFYRELYERGLTISNRCKRMIELSGNVREKDGFFYNERETKEKYEISCILDYHEFKTDAVTGDGLDFEYVKEGLNVQQSTTMGQEERRQMAEKFLWIDKKEKHFITHQLGAPRVYIFDTCTNLIAEARKKNVKKEASEKSAVSERKIQNRDDHLMDCAEYLFSELRWIAEDREII